MRSHDKENENKRGDSFEILVEGKEEFKAVLHQNITTDIELCRSFLAPFKAAYADFEGFTVEVGNSGVNNIMLPSGAATLPNGFISITAWFNHRERENGKKVLAFSQEAKNNKNEGEAVRRIERLHRFASEGIKFYPTIELKEGLEPFISDVVKDRHHKIDWKRIAFDVAAPDSPNTTLSLVRGLDPVKLLNLIYKDTDKYNYAVQPISPLPNRTWSVAINKFNIEELDRAARSVGFINTNTLGLIK